MNAYKHNPNVVKETTYAQAFKILRIFQYKRIHSTEDILGIALFYLQLEIYYILSVVSVSQVSNL